MKAVRMLSVFLVSAAMLAGCSRGKADYVKSGDEYFAQGKFREAAVEYRNAVNKDGNFGEARLKLGDTYSQLKDPAAASREYVRAADLLPGSRDAQLKAGMALLLVGRFDDARVKADKMLAANGRDSQALMLRAASAAGLKDFDGALARVQEAIEVDPSQAGGYVNLGSLEAMRGKNQEAEAAFQKAISVDPKSATLRLAYANYQIATGKAPEAEQTLKAAVEIDPKSVAAQRALANLYIATNRAKEAEPNLRAAAATGDLAGQLALADYLVMMNRGAESEEILRALAQKPEYFNGATLRLARVQAASGKLADAHKSVEAVLAKKTDSANALTLQARLYLAEKQLDPALSSIGAAVASDPKSAEARYVAAQVQLARGDVKLAKDSLNEVLKLNPRAAVAQAQLARVELSTGGNDRALELAAGAVKLLPADGNAHLTLARTLIVSGNLDRAEQEMKPLIAQHADNADVQAHYGMLKLARHDSAAARTAFDAAMAINPSNMDAIGGLTELDMAQNQRPRALQRLQDRLAADPNNARLLMTTANVQFAMKNAGEAEALLKKTILASPYALEAYGALGTLYMRQGRLEEARHEFETLAQRRSDPEGPLTMVGMILELQKKPEEAKRQYEAIIAKAPSAAVASNNLAWLYAENGEKLDYALQLAQSAKQQLPKTPEIDDTLGVIYLKKGLASLAIPPLEDAVKAAPKAPIFLYRLAMAKAQVGQKAAAKDLLQRALALGDFAEAKDARTLLASL